jgi:hypothetical protein
MSKELKILIEKDAANQTSGILPRLGEFAAAVNGKEVTNLEQVTSMVINPVDGVTFADGAIATTGINTTSIGAPITAYAGGGQANATELTKQGNIITTAGTEGDSVKLPVGVLGQTIDVVNSTAVKIEVFPATGEQILGGATNASAGLPTGAMAFTFSGSFWSISEGGDTTRKTNNIVEKVIEDEITKASILAMHGAPLEVVGGVAGASIEFISAVLIYDYDTAAYGGGGNITIGYDGGVAVSTTVVKTNAFGASGDKVFSMAALNAAGGYTMPVNTGLVITNASGAFTDPGTAAGVGRLHITYKIHNTGL